jgi:excisionase family DNA binding protein
LSEHLTYTVGEAAKAIGVGRSLAYELVRRGDLRTVHVGRRVLVPRDAVRDFLGLGQEQAPPPSRATPENGAGEVTYLVTIRPVRAGREMNTPSVSLASW